MEINIAAQSLTYPVMAQTGGWRKSGGIRAIFYYFVRGETVYMIDAYPKSRKESLTHAEKSALRKLPQAIEDAKA